MAIDSVGHAAAPVSSGADAGTLTTGAAGAAEAAGAAGAGALLTAVVVVDVAPCGQVLVTTGADGVGVGVATPLDRGSVPTNTGNVTLVCWLVNDEMAYAANVTPRLRAGTVTCVVNARGSEPVAPGTALPRKVPPLSRSPRKRSTRAMPEPELADGSYAVPEIT